MSNVAPHFKTRARLLCQLGEQLIKSESIALLELVKNAYDADATYCEVKIKKPESIVDGSIIIQDNGIGMNLDTIKNVWLEIGTDNKKEKKEKGGWSSKYKRIPLGEKGIGRLGIHRLGREIKIISRMENQDECVLNIDWDQIESAKYIEDFPVSIETRKPKTFVTGSGTKIIIKKIRKKWLRGDVRDVARQIRSLNSPFDVVDSFSVKMETDNDWLKGLLEFDDIKDKHLYSFHLKIEKDKITEFIYDFKPYESLDKVSPRHVTYESVKPMCRMLNEKEETIDLSKYKIGTIIVKGLIFDFDTKILNLGLSAGKQELKLYMARNGGVRVFRDKMRVWDYGESDNDWLDLDAKRVNYPTFKLGNKQILAAVYLNGAESTDLVEKTNREGFVDNGAFRVFKEACEFAIEKVEYFRKQDKDLLRRVYNGKVTRSTSVVDTIENIRSIIEKGIKNKDLANELNVQLDRISDDYSRITGSLIKSAGAGLNLIAVMHQIQKIIVNLKYNASHGGRVENVRADINQLEKLTDGYGILVRNYKPKNQNLNNLLKLAIQNVALRFEAHGIEIIFDQSKKLSGVCSDNYFVNAIMNLFDNSIWWLKYAKIKDPKIYLTTTDEKNGYSTVIVADNGPGFIPSKDELGTPFLTAKPAGLGMGIGLHVTKEIMKSLGGMLIFPEKDDFDIPQQFQKGAIVALAFRKGK